jgi:hypothetical protein
VNRSLTLAAGYAVVVAGFAGGSALAALAGCGYQPMRSVQSGESRLHVALVRADVAEPTAADEVTSGVREELAQEGALAAGEGYPRVEVEVLRTDETSDGIVDIAGAPAARATEVGLVARAWIVAEPGGARVRDTGDVRAEDLVAVDPEARADALHHADALRAVARRVGARLARRVLGQPAIADVPP